MGKLEGKTALITGAGAGIGRDSALAFAREGAAVAVVDVRLPRAEQTAELVRAEGGRARAFECDVRFLDQAEKTIAAVLAEFGRIDAVFNDAGTTRPGDVVSVSLEDWEMVLDVNLRGTFNISRAALPHMLERGSGAIINMGSVDGLTGDRNMAAYNAAKAAVVNLSRSMAVDFGPRGIRTNVICPGVVGSPAILKTFSDEMRARMDRATPLRRIGRPSDIANVAVFLASDDSAYVNGAAIVADGGLMARTGIPG
ncbi:MAG TPA: SDR family NAD(P)-dependent oxidoreductase [Pseudomonadales bacterium]|nr:SDR family NAD(P)-dependent oxidoreductase [Pseudomonadales bacterium]